MFDGLDLGPRISGDAARQLDPMDGINLGLLAFWPLSQRGGTTATNIAPTQRHGALVNFAAPGWAVGQAGRCLTFDGVNDHINVGYRPLNNLPRGTFATRLRINGGGGVVYYEDGGGFNNFAVVCPAVGSGILDVYIGSNTSRPSATRTWSASTWYDVVVTWGDDIRIYIDGVLDATIAVSGGTTNATGDNDQMGRYSYGGGIAGSYSPCSLSHVRVWSRALTYDEVKRLRRDPWAGVPALEERLFAAFRSAATVHALVATGIGTGAPGVGSPALAQVHALAATGIGTGAPGVGSPDLAQVHALVATGIGTGAPGVGSPDLAQVHALVATDIGTGAPGVGSPDLAQVHALVATDIGTGAPGVGSPVLNPSQSTVRTVVLPARDRATTLPDRARAVVLPARDRTVILSPERL